MPTFGIFIIVFGVLGLLIVMGILSERARKAALTSLFNRLGGTASFNPTPTNRLDALTSIPMLRSLPRAEDGIEFLAQLLVAGRPTTLVMHRYSTGSGKSRRTHDHTIAAVDCPESWPELSVSPESIFHRLAQFFGSKDIQLDDAEFNKQWHVQGPDENFALVCLDQSVQSWLSTYAQGLSIRWGQGALCVIASRRLNAEEIEGFLLLPGALLLALPEELQAY
jgi:hypothetical protein